MGKNSAYKQLTAQQKATLAKKRATQKEKIQKLENKIEEEKKSYVSAVKKLTKKKIIIPNHDYIYKNKYSSRYGDDAGNYQAVFDSIMEANRCGSGNSDDVNKVLLLNKIAYRWWNDGDEPSETKEEYAHLYPFAHDSAFDVYLHNVYGNLLFGEKIDDAFDFVLSKF